MTSVERGSFLGFRDNLLFRLNLDKPDPNMLEEKVGMGRYEEIFAELSGFPHEEKERFLIEVFGDPRVGIPNGVEVAKELTRINDIKWFSPQEKVDEAFIQDRAKEVQERLLIPEKPLLIIQQDWNAASDAVQATYRVTSEDGTLRAVWDNIRIEAGGAAWNIGLDIAEDVAWEISDMAGGAATVAILSMWRHDVIDTGNFSWDLGYDCDWIMVEDIMRNHPKYNKGNPFKPLVDLYEKGLWPIGITESNFVVFHPEVVNPV